MQSATQSVTQMTSTLRFWIEWSQAIVVILGAIVGVVTLVLYFREYRRHNKEYKESNKRLRAEKAVEMAQVFAEKIVPLFVEILPSQGKKGAWKEICAVVSSRKDLSFDINEARKIIPDDLLKRWVEESGELKKNDGKYEENMVNLLNHLEYMSMCFEYNIAQEDIVYQSLFQSFLLVLQTFYLDISIRNNGYCTGPRKYYTNSISLYNRWNNRWNEKKVEYEESIAEHKNALRAYINKEDELRRQGETHGLPLEI